MVPRYDYTVGFASLIPESEVWRDDRTDFVADSVQIFTVAFKFNGAIGGGFEAFEN